MADAMPQPEFTLTETIMRFAPAAVALSLALAVTSSVSWASDRDPAPRAATLIEQGKSALRAGDTQGAIDAYEAALAIDPGYTPILIHLAEAARQDDLQGKAIHYYREALSRNPRNIAAIAGEGAALAEKGAMDKARLTLEKVRSLCGESCVETQDLAAAIAAGPKVQVKTAEVDLPDDAEPKVN